MSCENYELIYTAKSDWILNKLLFCLCQDGCHVKIQFNCYNFFQNDHYNFYLNFRFLCMLVFWTLVFCMLVKHYTNGTFLKYKINDYCPHSACLQLQGMCPSGDVSSYSYCRRRHDCTVHDYRYHYSIIFLRI